MMDHHEMKPPVSADPGRMALAAMAKNTPASSFHDGCIVRRFHESASYVGIDGDCRNTAMSNIDPSGSSFMDANDHAGGSTWTSASTATANASEPAVRLMTVRIGSWA